MIVSHKYKLIFLKTTKTAGTSVEVALSEFLGDDDVITPLHQTDEELRIEKGFKGAQNYVLKNKGGNARLSNHTAAVTAKKILGEDIFDSYYKVAVARNPWERIVSAYFFQKAANESFVSFEEYLYSDRRLDGLIKHGWGIYTIDDKIVVDEVILYQNLNVSYRNLLQKLGISSENGLPFTKVAGKKATAHYSEMYDDKSIERVKNYFAKEIEAFGFQYSGM